MIHNLAELVWPVLVNVLKFGSAAYIITKGLIGTVRDLGVVAKGPTKGGRMNAAILVISLLSSIFGFAAGQPRVGLAYFALTYVVCRGLFEAFEEMLDGLIFLLED
jgi:hypothetical protein